MNQTDRTMHGYDGFAWFYEKYWGGPYYAQAFGVLERLLLKDLPPGSRILDLGCGTGHLSVRLSERGYKITGLDISEDMLAFARRKLPEAEFIRADARAFNLPSGFDAAVSGFESMSHILEPEGLTAAFVNTRLALSPGGLFVFDINTEETYRKLWHKSSAIVEDDHICIIRGGYEPGSALGLTDITMLRLDGEWKRTDLRLMQRGYSARIVREALLQAGFREAIGYRADEELGITGDFGVGRIFFRAVK